MKVDRLTRVNELLRREIGAILFRVLDPNTFDLAAVTITHVITSSDLRTARVLVSIRGHETERTRMLAQLKHCRAEIQRRIAEAVILKYTPRLTFVLDPSIESGDRVLALLDRLAPPQPSIPLAPPTREDNQDDQSSPPVTPQ